MWYVSLFSSFIAILIFLSGCGDTNSKTSVPEPPVVQASPLEIETPETQNPPSLFQCVGENFDSSGSREQVSKFDQELDLANWLYDGKTTILSTEKLELISSISKNKDLATLSLRPKENIQILYRVQQEPFHGFLQAGIRQSEFGGWAQCEGSPESFKMLKARPIRCFALWIDSKSVTSHFAFSISKSGSEWQTALETTSLRLLYRSTEHFILYKIVDINSELEVASAMTDRYFLTSRAFFDFNPDFVSIDCKSEGR